MESPVAGPLPGHEVTASRRVASPPQAETLFSLSRRHDLPFSVVTIRLRGRDEQADAGKDRLRRVVLSEIRQTDVSADWGDNGGAIVFCPATPPEGAKELAQRLRERAHDLVSGIGTASFRRDALTLVDLVEHAIRQEIESRPEGEDDDDSPPGSGSGSATRPMRPLWRHRARARIKRFFDLSFVVATAPLWLPVAALISLAVKLSDPSAPVLFRQERTGRGGQRFSMFKFRTMLPDAEDAKEDLLHRSQRTWPDFKIENDPRITRIGAWLRSTSLDELPQLWNVLGGSMSLVGPRPTSFAPETYETWQTARLEAVPGLTGLWQVEARNSSDFSERIRLDLRYVENQGFFTDLKILLRTIPAVLWERGGR